MSRRFTVASLLMVVSSALVFAVSVGSPLLFIELPASVPLEALDRFHFGIILHCSKILFGLSFVWFMIGSARSFHTKHLTKR
jgi:hypothetical protein